MLQNNFRVVGLNTWTKNIITNYYFGGSELLYFKDGELFF